MGQKEFKYIDDANNELGIDFGPASRDDLMITDTLVLPKGKKVKVNLKSRDVLHSFYLPHFRVKMDCVPGTPLCLDLHLLILQKNIGLKLLKTKNLILS